MKAAGPLNIGGSICRALILSALCVALTAGCAGHSTAPLGLGPGSGQPDPAPVQGLTDAGGRPLLPPSGYVPANPSRYHEISAAQVGIDGIDSSIQAGANNYELPADHALVIQPGGEDDLLAYAMYALTDLNTERPAEADFSIAAAPIQPGGEEDLPLCFWVGISDYTSYSWEWHGPYTSLDNTMNVDLNDLFGGADIRDRYISAANVLYMVVLTEAGAEFVGPGNPLGLTAARIDLLTVNKLTVGELGYRSTRPHFPLIESIGVGVAASGAKQAAAIDPSQYVTLTWTHVFDSSDPDSEAIQYKIYRKGPDDASMIPIGSVNAPEQQYIDPTDNATWVPEVVPGAMYTYYLRAYNNAGFTAFSSAEYVIPFLPPANLQASDGAFLDKIALTWTKAEGATGYKVYRDGQAETDLIATLGDVDTYDDTGVTDFDPHTYWVRGTNQYVPDGAEFSAPDTGSCGESAPVASLTADPLNGYAPLAVDFDASASHDPDDGVGPGAGIDKYEWDWESDGTYDFDSGTDPTVSHTYDTEGSYLARVRVTDNDSFQGTAEVGIDVSASPAPLIYSVDPTSGEPSAAVTFSASVDGAAPLTYEWDFGGGATPNTSSEVAPLVTLNALGTYSASLTVTNGFGFDTFNFELSVYKVLNVLPVPSRPGSDVDFLQVLIDDPVIRRDSRLAIDPFGGSIDPIDAAAYSDVLKTNGDEFAISIVGTDVYPHVVVVETASPAGIVDDDPLAVPGIVVIERRPDRITLDISVITLEGLPSDPDVTYSFRIFGPSSLVYGEGSFDVTPLPIIAPPPAGIGWGVNAWNREALDIGSENYSDFTLDGTTISTSTPDVLWFKFADGWIFDWDDQELTNNVRVVLTDTSDLTTMSLPLRLCTATGVSGTNYICNIPVKSEHFAAPYGVGILVSGHTYDVGLDDLSTGGIDWVSADQLQVIGHP